MEYTTKLAVLKFNLGTLVDIKAKTGKDPLTAIADERDVPDSIEFGRYVFEAGCRSNKIEVPDGYYDFSFQEVADLITAFVKAYSVPGEVNRDTQPGQTVAA